MGNKFFFICCIAIVLIKNSYSQIMFEKDTIETSGGNLVISFIGHGTLMFQYDDLTIHIDPTMQEADYSKMPKADIILVTHEHGDHLDLAAIEKISGDNTKLIMTQKCLELSEELETCIVMKNGDKRVVQGIEIEAVPAYNIKHMRSGNNPFHPKGVGNGYILSFDNKRVYVAGDTENTPEMKALKNIDIAFLPMNLPYTMNPEMVADAAKAFKPKILYPYHYGSTNISELIDLLKNENKIEVRIRDLR